MSAVSDAGRALCPTSHALGVGRKARPTAGFTLLEILLAVALIALLSAALVSTAIHLTDSKPRSNDQVFWEAVHLARRAALRSQGDVTLSFDDKSKAFVMVGADLQQSFPLATTANDLAVEFLHPDAGNSAILIRGQLVETQTIPSVTFYGDGTCIPFRVQFRANGAAHVIAIDPWTCAPVLTDNSST
jgi:general secretion pathway protein H